MISAEAEDDQTIEIPTEYEHLLMPLTAYYYLFTTNSLIATQFKAEYERMLSIMESNFREEIDNSYEITVGWA
jgi:hypothetical protein